MLTGNEISLLSASAELSPDTFTTSTNSYRQASASVVIDGDNRKGRAGGLLEDILKCATTSMESRNNPLKYLLIKMKSAEYISYVRLHLRDGLRRQQLQNGLTVSVVTTLTSNMPRGVVTKCTKPCVMDNYRFIFA